MLENMIYFLARSMRERGRRVHICMGPITEGDFKKKKIRHCQRQQKMAIDKDAIIVV